MGAHWAPKSAKIYRNIVLEGLSGKIPEKVQKIIELGIPPTPRFIEKQM